MEWLVALIALSAMEIVLGIDNIVFLAIVTAKLPAAQRPAARKIGLTLALAMRIALLFAISLVMGLTQPVFLLTDLGVPSAWFAAEGEQIEQISEARHHSALLDDTAKTSDQRLSYAANEISWRDIILLAGGLFLIGKSVFEIHEKLEDHEREGEVKPVSSFWHAMVQIAILDIIFSLDSVITAVGMANELWVMVAAVIMAVAVMMIFANPISDFVGRHPSLTMLALSFLILIGVMLVAEGIGTHVNKGYIYFAMAFSLVVEFLNLRIRKKPATTE